LTALDFDIFGIAETNIDWRTVPEQDRLYSRTREWWESSHLSISSTTATPPVDRRQWGGNAIFSIDKAAHRVIEKGSDPLKLGRWCWTKYRGKDNQTLRIYCAYCPNPPSGPLSVFSQHRVALLLSNDTRNPRVAFAQDISQDIKAALENQEKVILMLDGNSDMRESPLATALKNSSLTEVLLHRHGISGPSTFRRNQTRTPIDGIWASPGISILAGGYLHYDHLLTGADHCTLWIDVSFVNAFGHVMSTIAKPKARRLHCQDPRVVYNYVRRYEVLAQQHQLLPKIEDFMCRAQYPLSLSLQEELETLDNLRVMITAEAEKKCRKLRKGQVAFSPELQQASRTIKAYSLIQKKLLGKKVSSRLIRRSLKKAGIPTNVHGLSIEEIKTKLKDAYNSYYTIKKDHIAKRQTHLEELAEALAEVQNINKSNMLRQLRKREHQRAVARKIRYLQGKAAKVSTTVVTIESPEGGCKDITDKSEIEEAIMKSNEAKFRQSHHRPFFSRPS
jgi:hypothetical protein